MSRRGSGIVSLILFVLAAQAAQADSPDAPVIPRPKHPEPQITTQPKAPGVRDIATTPPKPMIAGTTACDRLTANADDPAHIGDTVPFYAIDARAAIAACRQALKASPTNARFALGLGLALDKARRYGEAMTAYRKALDLGSATAVAEIGSLYHFGGGVPVDGGQAAKLYQEAIDKGSTLALTNLGLLYADGLGVKQDYAKAVKLLEAALAKGEIYSYSELGRRRRHQGPRQSGLALSAGRRSRRAGCELCIGAAPA